MLSFIATSLLILPVVLLRSRAKVLFRAKKRLPPDVALEDWLKYALDQIAQNPKLNIYDLLPPERAPNSTSN